MKKPTDRDRLQFYSACRCYEQRDKTPPSVPTGSKFTWADWFEKRYGETLHAYFVRAKAEDMVARIVKWEGDDVAQKRADSVRELMRAERSKRLKKKPGRKAK